MCHTNLIGIVHNLMATIMTTVEEFLVQHWIALVAIGQDTTIPVVQSHIPRTNLLQID